MDITITKPYFPNYTTILTFLLLLLHPNAATSTANFDALDQWISGSLKSLQQRSVEIAEGIDVGLEASLVLAEGQPRIITVRQDGTGQFKTITDAIESIPTHNYRRTILKIGPGVYKEKIRIDRSKPYVTFYGEPSEMPTISFDGTAAKFGTVDSATVAVESHYFIASNIIFENCAPKPVLGVVGGQAVAMRISGDKAAFYNCNFHGYQDTLCDDKGRHFFKDCYIRGTVDFIFGNGRSIYLNCTIESVAEGITAITAQARSTIADKSGFSFLHCNITGSGNAYLSRAWKESSRVVFAYSYMGSLVNPEGWDDKGFSNRHRSVFYGEYKCMGPGASTGRRVSYAKLLTGEQAKPFLSMTFIRGKTWLLPPPTL